MDPNTLAAIGTTLAFYTLVEAAVAVASVVAVAEAPAIASGIATALAVGGFTGGVAALSLVGISIVGIVAIGFGAYAIAVTAQSVATQLASRAPTTPNNGQSGEQTDFSVPTVPPLTIEFSVDDAGNVTARHGVGAVDLGNVNVPGQSNVAPTLSLDLNLSPVPDLSTPAPTPEAPAPTMPDPGDIGLFSVAVPEQPQETPFPSSLVLLLLGILATTRRLFR